MNRNCAVFGALLVVGCLSLGAAEAKKEADPIAGIWRGTHTAGGAGYEHYTKVEKRGNQYAAMDLTFRGLDEQEAQKAMMKQLPNAALIGRNALCVQQQYLVTWDGTTLTFKGVTATAVLKGAGYKVDTFTGPMKTPGVFAGKATDTKGTEGRFRFWKDGALEAARPAPPAAGKTEKLACLEDNEYHYSVYLPKGYDPTKSYPLLMNFDPGGNGRPLLPKMADEAGWIMVGLTESKNGPREPIMMNRDAALFDIRRRFNVDWQHVYFSGLSGGARAASTTACNYPTLTRGLICIGAAYGEGTPAVSIPIFFIAGETDMNRNEVAAEYKQSLARKRKAELVIHPGGHDWGRPEDHEAAIRWLVKETIGNAGK